MSIPSKFRDLERRLKVAHVPSWYFLHCLELNASAPGDCLTKLSIDGVPEGTIVITLAPDPMTLCTRVLLYNEAWEVISERDLIPLIEVKCETVVVKASVPRPEEIHQPIGSIPSLARQALHEHLARVGVDPAEAGADRSCPTTVKLASDGVRCFLDTVPVIELPLPNPVDVFTTDWSTEKPGASWRDEKPLL